MAIRGGGVKDSLGLYLLYNRRRLALTNLKTPFRRPRSLLSLSFDKIGGGSAEHALENSIPPTSALFFLYLSIR